MRTSILVLTTLMASTLVGATAGTGVAQAAANPEQQVIALTNQHRAANGCGPLADHRALAAAAKRHNDEMAAHGNFSHNGVNGTDPGKRISEAGYAASRWAENIASGYGTADEAVAGWMKSPGHRANILDCRLVHIGVAYNPSGNYWTQDFGAPA